MFLDGVVPGAVQTFSSLRNTIKSVASFVNASSVNQLAVYHHLRDEWRLHRVREYT
jgi:hypothetical protein